MKFAAFIILLFAISSAFAINVEPLLQNTTIDYSALANLTGSSKDIVIVTGIHDFNRIGWDHDLLILDQKGAVKSQLSLPATEGCYDKIIIADIDNDKKDEIILTRIGFTESLYLFKWQNSKIMLLQTFNDKGLPCKLENGFKISVQMTDVNETVTYNFPYEQLPAAITANFDRKGTVIGKTPLASELFDFIIEKGRLTSLYKIIDGKGFNTLAIVKTVLELKDASLTTGKLQLFRFMAPDEYQKRISKLDINNRPLSITKAVNLFNNYFYNSPPSIQNQAIRYFNTFHDSMMKIENEKFYTKLNTYRKDLYEKIKDSKTRLDKIESFISIYNNTTENVNAGFKAIYAGEGEWNIKRKKNFLIVKFPNMSDDAKRYYQIIDTVISSPAVYDAGIVISMPEIYNRIISAEQFLTQYSESTFASQVYVILYNHLSLLIIGTDNSPISDWNTLVIKPSIRNEIKKYIIVIPYILKTSDFQDIFV